MRRWFLSYNSQDLTLIQGLDAALKRKDSEANVFLAPKSLRVGGFWLPTLAKEIAEATAFVMLVGANGVGPWQVIEYYEALDRRVKDQQFPVILLLLDGQAAPGLPFLRQLHWITTPDPTSETCIAQLLDAAGDGGTAPGELWRHTAPYRGLVSMTEADTDFFFGRGNETGEVIRGLAAASDKLSLLLGNSGVGKSSVAQAGVLAALMRQAWPDAPAGSGAWPQAFNDSRRWCVLKLKPGAEPVRALVEPFIRTWQFDPTDPRRETRQAEWIGNLIQGSGTLRGLLDATEDRLQEQEQSKPPAFLLYIDQGEELYVRADERQRRCFSKIVAEGLADPRLRAVMSMRADFFGELQKDPLLYAVHRQINVPPLRETELHEVVSRPAELLAARFETDGLAGSIAERAAEESTKDAGALPLLSYLLDDMWKQMIQRGDGVLRLPQRAIELGAVLVDRANSFLVGHPKSEEQLRRIFTLKLATVREDGEPTRRRAYRSEFSEEEWTLVSDLADHPNRLLVTVMPESEAGEAYAEVAHEAIFRRWDKLREWIAAERQFLAWRSSLEVARRTWEATPDASKSTALLMGFALNQAQRWHATRAEDISSADRAFIMQSSKAARRRRLRVQLLAAAVLAGIILDVALLRNPGLLKNFVYDMMNVTPLASSHELTLAAGASFHECSDCPEMIVVPPGSFVMGSPDGEQGRSRTEGPQHPVTIAKRFAVSRHELSFAEWDACEDYGACPHISEIWGRGLQPVIKVSLHDAITYVTWLSNITGKHYRLLTESEYEYATRAGGSTVYPWGDAIGVNNANCRGCASQWDGKQPAPVDSFPANRFGLKDMVGNVYERVADCFHSGYFGAPPDGSAWASSPCDRFVVRGGSYIDSPDTLRSAFRGSSAGSDANVVTGFRVARELLSP